MVRRPLAKRRSLPRLEALEVRVVLSLTIDLIPDFDQFGDQVAAVQAFGDTSRTGLGIFDTGASAVTFSPDDVATFESQGDPIGVKVVGGALAGGIGGEITGDVSVPGTIIADGFGAAELTFDDFGFPVFDINFRPGATATTPGIQAFLGTYDGSPNLPTIAGTPLLHKSSTNPNGLAALIEMQGAVIDLSDLFPGLTIAMPDVKFVPPTTKLRAVQGLTTAPIKVQLTPFGGDNFTNPGNEITDTKLSLVPRVSVTEGLTRVPQKSFLFDTGAQLSVVSSAVATALGLDLNNPETSITVSGVGGQEEIPGFTIDAMRMPLIGGGFLKFTSVPIYVLDVAPGIDGIIGMNLFNTAHSLLYNPNAAGGPTLSMTFLLNPDRSDPGDIFGSLNALIGASFIHGGRFDDTPELAFIGNRGFSVTAASTSNGVVMGTANGESDETDESETDTERVVIVIVVSLPLSSPDLSETVVVSPEREKLQGEEELIVAEAAADQQSPDTIPFGAVTQVAALADNGGLSLSQLATPMIDVNPATPGTRPATDSPTPADAPSLETPASHTPNLESPDVDGPSTPMQPGLDKAAPSDDAGDSASLAPEILQADLSAEALAALDEIEDPVASQRSAAAMIGLASVVCGARLTAGRRSKTFKRKRFLVG